MSNTFQIAKNVLSEIEKDRFVACYLNMADPNAGINWEKAASDFGSASVGSFKKMIQTAQKKIKEAEANGGAPSTPAKSPSKKRKGKGDDDGGAAPSKKKGGKGAKKAAAPVDDGDDDEEKASVKQEESEDVWQ